MPTARVSCVAELMDALASADDIEVNGSLTGMPMISLRPGVSLRGGSLRFGAKGIRLSSDNRIENVTVIVPVGDELQVPAECLDVAGDGLDGG